MRELGLIPAHAGKTKPDPGLYGQTAAHPRSRGENAFESMGGGQGIGSSPLTRGKPKCGLHGAERRRLIPAHAGKTSDSLSAGRRPTAHPRSRGENVLPDRDSPICQGSSPLTRGKPVLQFSELSVVRLIPAHAGKTSPYGQRGPGGPAHPRSRGENRTMTLRLERDGGSSPLTRGKRERRRDPIAGARLIPAHAGKTYRTKRSTSGAWAHPRSRGENAVFEDYEFLEAGSSPLTRGKRDPVSLQAQLLGLIPAHAGKTLPDMRFYCADRSDLGNP